MRKTGPQKTLHATIPNHCTFECSVTKQACPSCGTALDQGRPVLIQAHTELQVKEVLECRRCLRPGYRRKCCQEYYCNDCYCKLVLPYFRVRKQSHPFSLPPPAMSHLLNQPASIAVNLLVLSLTYHGCLRCYWILSELSLPGCQDWHDRAEST